MKLIFVYNADSGKINALQDSIHKIISPATYSCRLCQLTHSFFKERKEWSDFVKSLNIECEFLHKDEFPEKKHKLPAVFLSKGNKLKTVISAEQFGDIQDLPSLISFLQNALA